MRKRTKKMERKMKSLRKKYFEGYASDYYMETGIPLQFKQKVDEADEWIKKMKGEYEKNVRKAKKTAEKAYKKNQRKRKTKAEERLVFM